MISKTKVSLNTISLLYYKTVKNENKIKEKIKEMKFSRLRNTNKIDEGSE